MILTGKNLSENLSNKKFEELLFTQALSYSYKFL